MYSCCLPDRCIRQFFLSAGELRYVVYEQDKVHLIVFSCQEPLTAWHVDKPIETDDLKWLADHPECDSIIDHIGRILRVYAYAW